MKNVSDEALTFGKLPEDKALGVKWNISVIINVKQHL